MRSIRFASGLLAFVGGCAAWTPGETECRNLDWHARGESDGLYGHPPQIIRLAQQCRRHGIEASETAYRKGWEAGHWEWDRLMGSIGPD